jgi:hypothetical protein
MKKEINPAVAVIVIVVIVVLLGGYIWNAQSPRVLPPVPRGSVKPNGTPTRGGIPGTQPSGQRHGAAAG